MKRFFRVTCVVTFAAAWFLSSNAYALDACRVFRDSNFEGGFLDIAKNTSLPDLGAYNFQWNGRICSSGPSDPESGVSRCKTGWHSMGRAVDEVSSVQVPRGCYLYLHEHTGYNGAVAAWEAGDHPEVYVGIPNDAASSARCSCGAPPVGEIVIIHPPR